MVQFGCFEYPGFEAAVVMDLAPYPDKLSSLELQDSLLSLYSTVLRQFSTASASKAICNYTSLI